MVKGWHFTDGVQHYYVGAPDVEAAKKTLSSVNAEMAKKSPEEIPSALARFFPLHDGKVATGRLWQG